MIDTIFIIIILLIPLMTLAMMAVCFFTIVQPWLKATMSGGPVSVAQILGMRLRRSPVPLLLDEYLTCVHQQQDIGLAEIESIYIANRMDIYDQDDLHRHVEAYLKSEDRLKN